MLTIREIAQELKVHPQTVYRWIYRGKLKARKIDGIVRVDMQDYQDFIGGSHSAERSTEAHAEAL